jgi:transcriptional regulator with XRE-family HTH domain
MDLEGIGGRVKRLRQSAGLSVEALAARSGITSNAIRQLERGDIKKPAFDTGVMIANALGVSAEEILGVTPQMARSLQLLEQRAAFDADISRIEQEVLDSLARIDELLLRVSKLETDFDAVQRFEELRRSTVAQFAAVARQVQRNVTHLSTVHEQMRLLDARIAALEAPDTRKRTFQ